MPDGDEKCTFPEAEAFKTMVTEGGELITAKEAYYTEYEKWVNLWFEKNIKDRMCSVKSKNFRFSQVEEQNLDHKKIFEEHFKGL